MPRNGIAESYGNCMCKFLRNCFPQWLHHLDSYEEYFKLMNTLICAFGGNKQSSMLRSTQGLNCWVLLCSDVELWLNAASFPEPAVRQLCEVLAVRSSLVLAVLAVITILTCTIDYLLTSRYYFGVSNHCHLCACFAYEGRCDCGWH